MTDKNVNKFVIYLDNHWVSYLNLSQIFKLRKKMVLRLSEYFLLTEANKIYFNCGTSQQLKIGLHSILKVNTYGLELRWNLGIKFIS